MYSKNFVIILFSIAFSVFSVNTYAQSATHTSHAHFWSDTQQDFAKAKIINIQTAKIASSTASSITQQTLEVVILNGDFKNRSFTIIHEYGLNQLKRPLTIGETIVVERTQMADGSVGFFVQDQYRLPWVILLTVIFIGIAFLTGGILGLRSLLGLFVSIAILGYFIIPSIINGGDPLLISIVGSVCIACFSLYLAHGNNKRTTIALVATIITLVLSTCLAFTFVYLAKLFGTGSEEILHFSGNLQSINFKGLLLGGIIIGSLGVLDDITTAQVATVDELSKANTALSSSELFKRGMSVGREHVAALINTLALAYAGASLPLILILFHNQYYPKWVLFNSEFIAEEIIRTLIGSSALLLAVPIATWFAAKTFAFGNSSTVQKTHACAHHAH